MKLEKHEILDEMGQLIKKGEMTALEGHMILTRELIAKLTTDISLELIELLRNPSIRALLSPPTQLEIEVKEMVEWKRPAPAKYPVGKWIKKPIPVDFLKEHYKKYLDEWCIYLDNLRIIDKKLVIALKNYDTNNSTLHSSIIKPERKRVDFFVENLSTTILDKITSIGSILSTRKRMNIKNPAKNQNN